MPLLLAIGFSSVQADQGGIPLLEERQSLFDAVFFDHENNVRRLSQWQGKFVVLNIWATWCGPCRAEMPTLDRLQATLGGKHFEVVALSIDQAGIGVAKAFFEDINVQHLSLYIDPTLQAAQDLKVAGLPATILVDPDGYELGRLLGPAEWDSTEMIGFFENIIRTYVLRNQ